MPKSFMNQHPGFAALVVNNEVVIPGLNRRQGNLLATYLINGVYWALPTNYASTLLTDEEDFEDAVKLHRAGGQYHLPGLVSMARHVIIDMLRGQVSIHFIINTFESDPVWRDANAKFVQSAVSFRARSIEPYALITDLEDYGYEVETNSPIVDGLLEGLVVLKGRVPGVADDIEPYDLINQRLN